MNIVLIGPMGAGKTTIGKPLAKKLGMRYVSADKEAQKMAGVTGTNEIKERFGVRHYRKLLTEVITSCTNKDKLVVDFGEGIVGLPGKERRLKALGKIIFLTAKPEILWERIKNSEGRVQFLSTKGDPYKIYKRNLDINMPFFSIAAIRIDTSSETPQETASRISKILK